MSVSTEIQRVWTLEIIGNSPIDPEPANDEERAVLEGLKREIKAIIDAGGVPDVVGE